MNEQQLARRIQSAGMFADQIEGQSQQQSPEWAEAMRIAKMHARVFDSDAGRELLDYWIKIFMLRPIVRAGGDIKADAIREGQANVVRQLLMQLEVARTGPEGGQ